MSSRSRATSRPFEGLYGRCYSAMIRSRLGRRAFFGLWGGADVLYDLDHIVERITRDMGERRGAILDVPCGQGVLAELFAHAGWRGDLFGLDLAERAIDAAWQRADELRPAIDATYVHGTALDMPFADGQFAVAVSINGMHVMPDHAAFAAELARVLEPGGRLWMITPVRGPGLRARGMLRAGQRLGVLSQQPPTVPELEGLLGDAGLRIEERLGGSNIVGLVAVRE